MEPFIQAFVKVGDDLSLPEAPFEGPEPLTPETVSRECGSCAAMCARLRLLCFKPVGVCLAVVLVVLRNGPPWEIPSPFFVGILTGLGECSGACSPMGHVPDFTL